MSPESTTVQIGSSYRFTVAAFDTLGGAITAKLHFASENPAVFTVDGFGRVLGVTEGVATLVVTSGSARDTAVVTVIAAARGWFLQSSGVSGASLNSVFFQTNGRDGWVVGDAGRILHTGDGGDHWSTQLSGTTSTLESVWFASATEGWVVGRTGVVLHTTNGGTGWTRSLNTPATENLHAVHFATRDTGWVVGASGVILRTFDRGATWQRTARSSFDLNALSFAGTREGWVAGDNGVILGTHDGGRSWYTVQPGVTTLSLRGVWRSSTARANAVGAAGAAPRTVAAADSAAWELVNVGAAFDLHGVSFPTDLVGFAAGYNGLNAGGALLRSGDGGVSWLPQISNTTSRLNAVFFLDPLRGWAVGENGTIVHTVTGGLP